MEYTIPHTDYNRIFAKVSEIPADSVVIQTRINEIKNDMDSMNAELYLLQDKLNNIKKDIILLSRKNQNRLRTFINELKSYMQIASINVYVIRDDSASWYSDIEKDHELSLTLHADCNSDGNLILKGEIVTTFQHARELTLELLGPPTGEFDTDLLHWLLNKSPKSSE